MASGTGGQSPSLYTADHLRLIREQPHIISWILGKMEHSEIHSEWIKYIWTSGKSVALNAHRGSFKSTAIVYIGAIWYMLFNPEVRICLVRKTYDDAAKGLEAIAQMMSSPEIQELFYFAHGEYPKFTKRREGQLDFSFRLSKTPEGSLTALGLKSPFTGKHFDFIICDDISTVRDKYSRAEREFTKTMWRELATNIIDPGKPCCYIGTPWHRDGVESIIPTPRKYSIHDVDILTPEQIEDKKASCTPAEWAANYLLTWMPDEGMLFRDPQTDAEWHDKGIESVRAHIDSAYGGKDSCAVTIAAKRTNGQIQVYGAIFPGNIKDWVDVICEKFRAYKVRKMYCEKQSDRGYTGMLFRAKGINVCEYDENLNKQHKIATHLYAIWPAVVFTENTDPAYLGQIVDWTHETKDLDDAPDSLASLARQCYSKSGSRAERWKL